MAGLRLLLLHPEVAARSCEECRMYLFHDKGPDFGPPVERGGKRIKRAPGQRPPCSTCHKQPDDVPAQERRPETAVELSPKNWQAYVHYLECKAVSQFPTDPLVRRNAFLIRQVEDLADQVRRVHLPVIGQG